MATATETAGGRAGPPRRFTLLDGMIAVAALAAGLGLARCLGLGIDREFHGRMWTDARLFFRSWMIDEFVVQLFRLGTVATLSATLAVFAWRLRRPRPGWRRMAGQPGMAAALAAGAAWLIMLPWMVLWHADSSWSFGEGEALGVGTDMAAVLAGFGVASRWGMLLLSRRWRCEPSWIDRSGRLVGVCWMALGLWGISFRAVC